MKAFRTTKIVWNNFRKIDDEIHFVAPNLFFVLAEDYGVYAESECLFRHSCNFSIPNVKGISDFLKLDGDFEVDEERLNIGESSAQIGQTSILIKKLS